jgi:hypothetical protein
MYLLHQFSSLAPTKVQCAEQLMTIGEHNYERFHSSDGTRPFDKESFVLACAYSLKTKIRTDDAGKQALLEDMKKKDLLAAIDKVTITLGQLGAWYFKVHSILVQSV